MTPYPQPVPLSDAQQAEPDALTTDYDTLAEACGDDPSAEDSERLSKPTLTAYTVKERGNGQKPIWTRIGAAWPHGTGTGFTLELEALPLDGRIVLVEPKADPATTKEGAGRRTSSPPPSATPCLPMAADRRP